MLKYNIDISKGWRKGESIRDEVEDIVYIRYHK